MSGATRLPRTRTDLLRAWRRPPARREAASSLALASGKGGTGKSVLAAALAYLAVVRGRRSTVFDADFGVGNAHLLQGLTADLTVAHVVAGRVDLDDVASLAPTGVRVVPAGCGVRGLDSLARFEVALLANGLRKVESSADFLVLDAAAGISERNLLFASACDLVLVVTTPDLTAMTNAYAWIKVCHGRDSEVPLALVVNRVREAGQADAVARRIQGVARRFLGIEVPCLGALPEDPTVGVSVARRCPFPLVSPGSPATRAAENLLDAYEAWCSKRSASSEAPSARLLASLAEEERAGRRAGRPA